MTAERPPFQRGDRVRVKKTAQPFSGQVGKVVGTQMDLAEIKFNRAPKTVCYFMEELERVEEKP